LVLEKRVPLSLTTRWSGDIPIVVCRGRIVEGPESVALREHLEKELAQQSLLVLDLTSVDFIDSSGLGLLVRFAMRVGKEGGELKLCGVAPRIQTTLKTTKVNTVLKAYPSEAEAIAAFSVKPQPRKSAPRKADILCVTSSTDLLAYLGHLLQQAGYAVSTTNTLAEAANMLAAARPRLLLIDAALSGSISGDPALRDQFNALIDGVAIVELPADYSTSDAGTAARLLVRHLRSVLSANQSGTPAES
jgi:anti-sigma B factor antagonist